MTAPAPSLADALRNRYTLERELGRGGMATVYLAQDLKHDRSVALKVLHPELAASLGSERFLREIRLTARLQHPHILPVHDSGEAAGQLWYTMPYVEGESLRARLERDKQLPLDDALQIARNVLAALAYAHSHGILHRDIKPENILLEAGEAVVADFGMARAISAAGGDSLTQTGMAVGTPVYMSPEQAAGKQELDGRSDLYAVGCVLYEMLAGHPPFMGTTAQEILMRHAVDPVPPLRSARGTVPEAVEQATTKALAKAPADRFGSAGEFAVALEATAPGAAPALRRAPLRSERRVGVALLVALAVLVPGVVWLSRAHRPALDPKRVAVAVFENRTGDPALDPLGSMAADWLTRGLLQTGVVDVVDPGAVYVQASSSARQPADPRRTAEQNGAGVLVAGSYYLASDSVVFQSAVRETRTGRMLLALEPISAPRSQPLRGVETLRQQVMAGLAELVDPRFSAFVPEGSQVGRPPAFEAYKAFIAAQHAHWEMLDYTKALALFRRAAALDTSFLTAAVWVALEAAPPPDQCAVTDSVGHALEARRERLSRFDRLTLDYALARCRGDPEDAYRLLREQAEAFPRSSYAQFAASHRAIQARRPREAAVRLAALKPERDLGWLPHKAWYWGSLAWAYHAAGDHRAELAVAQRFARRTPPHLYVAWFEGRAYAGLGRSREVLERVAQASSLPGEGPDPPEVALGNMSLELSLELLAHGGDRASARVAAEQAVAAFRARLAADSAAPAGWRFALARALGLIGRYAEAEALVKGLVEGDSSDVRYQGYLGVLLAQRSDRGGAERTAARLGKVEGPRIGATQREWRARIAAALGRREQAVELLREAFARGLHYDADLHQAPEFQLLRGYAPFEALLRPKG